MLNFVPIMLFQYAQNCTNYDAPNLPIMLKLCPCIISGRSKLVCSNNYFRKSKLKQDGSSSPLNCSIMESSI